MPICEKHGLSDWPSPCPECERAEVDWRRWQAEAVFEKRTQELMEQEMKAPTQQQLNDPAWWDENAGTASHYCRGKKQFYDYRLHHAPCCSARPTKPQAPEWDGESAPAPGELATTSSGECQGLGWDAQREQVAVQWHDGELGVVAIGALKPRAKEDQERFELARDLLDDLSALDINVSGKTATALAISFMNRGWRKGDS